MAPFQILPAETKFFDWFDKASQNAIDAATELRNMMSDGNDLSGKLSRLVEIEHHGDFIVHEIFELLHKTFITPIDPPEIEQLTAAIDDVVDYIHAVADTVLIYRIDVIRPAARELADCLLRMVKEIAAGVYCLHEKKTFGQMIPHVIEINRLENDADRVFRAALVDLVEHRDDWFEFTRWKEVYQQIENACDRCEDVADVLRAVAIKYA